MKKVSLNRSGFSLVELIVVLVIMAILVAALVPSLIGYINQARYTAAKDEASSIVQAGQVIISSAYLDPDSTYYSQTDGYEDITFSASMWNADDGDGLAALIEGGNVSSSYVTSGDFLSILEYLSEIDVDGDDAEAEVTTLLIDEGTIHSMTFVASNGTTIHYESGTYSVEEG